MAERELPYFKFVSELIDSGIWSRMSPAARTLYPVLLRFSDRNFKPVYPGTQVLLKLTGFKQKASLRKARRELEELGLITVQEGTGRKNSYYQFRFDWGDPRMPPSGPSISPSGAPQRTSPGGASISPGEVSVQPPYNKIHISINNQVPEAPISGAGGTMGNQRMEFMERRFGKQNLELAKSECRMAGMAETVENLEKILYRDSHPTRASWTEIENYLSRRISPGSLEIIRSCLQEERGGVLFFSGKLPEYLKSILKQMGKNIFFEPDVDMVETGVFRQQFWNKADTEL